MVVCAEACNASVAAAAAKLLLSCGGGGGGGGGAGDGVTFFCLCTSRFIMLLEFEFVLYLPHHICCACDAQSMN
jgi:hypothetical protein